MNTYTTTITTPDGVFRARFTDQGLAALGFPATRAPKPSRADSGTRAPAEVRRWIKSTISAVRAVLEGEAIPSLPPLDLSSGTGFQRAVWQALAAIPRGETRSYSQVAHAIGRPRAVRAVGQACGANPIPLLIPCHRVLAAGGGLGGFSAGLEWKRRLLERERGRQA